MDASALILARSWKAEVARGEGTCPLTVMIAARVTERLPTRKARKTRGTFSPFLLHAHQSFI